MLPDAPRILPLLAIAGCSTPETPETAAASPWEWEGRSPEATVSAEELSVAVTALMDAVPTIHAAPVVSSYQEAMAYSQGRCPDVTRASSEATGDVQYWAAMCQGAEGVWFKGPMTYWVWEDIALAEGSVDIVSGLLAARPELAGARYYGLGIRGQTDIFNTDSSIDFNCSCVAMQARGQTPDGQDLFFSFTDGPTHWTGAAADGTWMREGLLPSLWSVAREDAETDRRRLDIVGDLSGFAERFDTASLSLSLSRPRDGSLACDADGALSLTIRDAETALWHPLSFVISADERACLACADWDDGERICVDLASYLDWDDSPW